MLFSYSIVAVGAFSLWQLAHFRCGSWRIFIVAVGAFSLWQLAELFLLIHSYIIDEILHRKSGIIYFATIIATQGQIEQEILRLLERLLAIAQLTIHRLCLTHRPDKDGCSAHPNPCAKRGTYQPTAHHDL